METIEKVAVVVGGLLFSFAVALLIEELIFGQVFRVAFGVKPVPVVAEARTRQASRGAASGSTTVTGSGG